MKRKIFRESNGRFRKAYLKDFGIPDSSLNTCKQKCLKCGSECFPILKTWICSCGFKNEVI